MTADDHLKQGEGYLSAASFFNIAPTGPAKEDAKPVVGYQQAHFLLELANAHFAAATVVATLGKRNGE